MDISIIIVNYNVKFFLEQCLHSVAKGINGLNVEVLVVDNASADGSIAYLQPKFRWVKFIRSEENIGFARANNLALYQCSGKYVLYLNPDTLLPEDCLQKCFSFLETHPDAGALGIRMVDGSGQFLPESKRSFPSPLTSFYKLIGLSSLFPKSKLFGKYALGYLDEHKDHVVDVLAGAFIMARRELLVQLKGFDETFFMYGEDIDLSYRIQQAGYKNYYFSGSSIIHFKGESTRKGSLNYVRMFYQAMSIFVSKHYTGGKAKLFRFFIQLAILLRAAVSAVVSFIVKIGLPLFDALIIFSSFLLVNRFWIKYVRHGDEFGEQLVSISLPGFTLLFLLAATLAGIYDNKYKPAKAFYAAVVATVVMLAVYSLLPERFRFSRGVILFGGLTALVLITLFRWLLHHWGVLYDDNEERRHQQTLVVATPGEYNEINLLLQQAGLEQRLMGRVAPNGDKEEAVATIAQLQALVNSIQLREIIFAQGYLSYKQIIEQVQKLPQGVCARFHANGSLSIVGSDSKDASGEFVSAEGNYQLAHPYQRRMKRIVDVSMAIFILITFPVQLVLYGWRILYRAGAVLFYKKTWVGYSTATANLPLLPPGVLTTSGASNVTASEAPAGAQQIDILYARQYHWVNDLTIIFRNYKHLGQ